MAAAGVLLGVWTCDVVGFGAVAVGGGCDEAGGGVGVDTSGTREGVVSRRVR